MTKKNLVYLSFCSLILCSDLALIASSEAEKLGFKEIIENEESFFSQDLDPLIAQEDAVQTEESLPPAIMAPKALSNKTAKTKQGYSANKKDPYYHFYTYLKHREGGGIGYGDGYSSLQALLGFGKNSARAFFIDLRAHAFNNGHIAANVGLGYRIQPWEDDYAFGFNGYYDLRFNNGRIVSQIGTGFEFFNKYIDLRTNLYLPFSHVTKTLSSSMNAFQGYNLLINKKQSVALTGGDLELGKNVYCNKYFSLYSAIGSYYFGRNHIDTGLGVKARLAFDIVSLISVQGELTHDKLFKTTLSGTLALHFPFGPKAKENKKRKTDCPKYQNLYEAPYRNEIIPLKEHTKQTVARDNSGNPMQFFHVNNTGSMNGNGTFEDPLATISTVNEYAPGNYYIYLNYGDGSVYDGGITLTGFQKLLGSGMDHVLSTRYGPIVIPAASPGLFPIITNSDFYRKMGCALYVYTDSKNIEVAGITVTKAARAGIFVSPGDYTANVHHCNLINNTESCDFYSQNAVLENCYISQDPDSTYSAIRFFNNFTLNNNVINGSESTIQTPISINPYTTTTFTITNNVIHHPNVEGIRLTSYDTTATTYNNCLISHNEFLSNGGLTTYYGVYVGEGQGSVANTYNNLQIVDNLFVGYTGAAIYVRPAVVTAGSANGLIDGNIFNNSVDTVDILPSNGGGLTVGDYNSSSSGL